MGKCRVPELVLLLLCCAFAVVFGLSRLSSAANAQNPAVATSALSSQSAPTVVPTPAISGGLDAAEILFQSNSTVERAGSYRLEQYEGGGDTRQLVRTGRVDIASDTLSVIAADGTSESILQGGDLYHWDGRDWTHEEIFEMPPIDPLPVYLSTAQFGLGSYDVVEIEVNAANQYSIHLAAPQAAFGAPDVTITIDRTTMFPVSIIERSMPQADPVISSTQATSIETIYMEYGVPVSITIPREALDELALVPLSVYVFEAGNGWQDVYIEAGISNPTLRNLDVPLEAPYVNAVIEEGYVYSFNIGTWDMFTDGASPFFQMNIPAGLTMCQMLWDGWSTVSFSGRIPVNTHLSSLNVDGFAPMIVPEQIARPNCIPDEVNAPDADDTGIIGVEEYGDSASIRVDPIDPLNNECCNDAWYFRVRIENLNRFQDLYLNGFELWAIDNNGTWIASATSSSYDCSFETLKYANEPVGPAQIRGATLCFPKTSDDQVIVAVVMTALSTDKFDVVTGMPIHWWEVFPRVWERFR